jgi:hypothetical protein
MVARDDSVTTGSTIFSGEGDMLIFFWDPRRRSGRAVLPGQGVRAAFRFPPSADNRWTFASNGYVAGSRLTWDIRRQYSESGPQELRLPS